MSRDSGFVSFITWIAGKAYFRRNSPFGIVEIGGLHCSKDEVVDIAGRFSKNAFRETKSGLWVFDESLHMRLVVYCGTVAGMRRKNSYVTELLSNLALRLDPVSLLFWYSEFVERYRKRGVRALYRVSSSLRSLYYVE
ncbi:MAG: hypothetical protein QXZ56_06295 [Sulfolobales archaeon]